MDEFHYNGTTIEFWKVTGEVLSNEKHSETHVSSYGGGGSVGTQGGYVSAPRVHSEVVNKQEFWIGTTDGREVSINLTNNDIPLREGQKITLIAASKKGASGWYSIIVNHNANKHWFINTAKNLNELIQFAPFAAPPQQWMENKNTKKERSSHLRPALLVGIVTLIVSSVLARNVGVGLILGVVVFFAIHVIAVVWLMSFKFPHRSTSDYDAVRNLDKHLEKLAQQAYANP